MAEENPEQYRPPQKIVAILVRTALLAAARLDYNEEEKRVIAESWARAAGYTLGEVFTMEVSPEKLTQEEREHLTAFMDATIEDESAFMNEVRKVIETKLL